jgi:hypothetical protein
VDIASGEYSGTSGTLTVDVDGSYWYGPNNISFANVDPGSVTVGDPGDFRGDINLEGLGDSFDQGQVPEPTTGGVILLTGAAVACKRRRNSN